MTTKKISESETASLKISSLPTRPTLPSQYGGRGYTASDMKMAFDLLPLFIIERFNSLLDDISAEGEGSIASEISTGLESLPHLTDIFLGIESGALADAIAVTNGESLTLALIKIWDELNLIKERLGIDEVAE